MVSVSSLKQLYTDNPIEVILTLVGCLIGLVLLIGLVVVLVRRRKGGAVKKDEKNKKNLELNEE